MLASNAELSRKLVAMEKNYDIKFEAIFEATTSTVKIKMQQQGNTCPR